MSECSANAGSILSNLRENLISHAGSFLRENLISHAGSFLGRIKFLKCFVLEETRHKNKQLGGQVGGGHGPAGGRACLDLVEVLVLEALLLVLFRFLAAPGLGQRLVKPPRA